MATDGGDRSLEKEGIPRFLYKLHSVALVAVVVAEHNT